MKINRILVIITLLLLSLQVSAQTKLLIRCDDAGMSHTVNMAIEKLISTGIPFSTSVMFACPWYQEAVEILKDKPQVSVGVHFTLNSEWKGYKWGPVLGKTVPSLTDSNGYFFDSEEAFHSSNYDIKEVEAELRAQIERALNTGLKIDYIDPHMGTGVSTPELRALFEKVTAEYNLGISEYFNENHQTLWEVAPENKLSELLDMVNNLEDNKLNLIVIHLGLETPEMDALVDMNNPVDPYRVSKHRAEELNALTSRAFAKAIESNNVQLITYGEYIEQNGLKLMIRPISENEGY